MSTRWAAVVLMLVALATTGCATRGGIAIGPISALTARANARAVRGRAVLGLRGIDAEQRRDAFRAVNLGMNDEEIAVGIGLDPFALTSSKLRAGELLRQAIGCAGDAALYGLMGWAGYEVYEHNVRSSSSPPPPSTANAVGIPGMGDARVVTVIEAGGDVTLLLGSNDGYMGATGSRSAAGMAGE